MRRKRTPILEITNCGRHGVVVDDARPRAAPLATHRDYSVTVFNDKGEAAATKRMGVWQWIRAHVRIGVYG